MCLLNSTDMRSRNEGQFNSAWQFFLQSPSTRAWLCDPTPVQLDQAVLLAQEPPSNVTAGELTSSLESKHTLYVLGRDEPFVLGTLTEEGDVGHDSHTLHGTAARSAIAWLPKDAMQLCAAFYWLTGGTLFVRIGVIRNIDSSNGSPAKMCTWTMSRAFEPQAAAGILHTAVSGGLERRIDTARGRLNISAAYDVFSGCDFSVQTSQDRRCDLVPLRQNCGLPFPAEESKKNLQTSQPKILQSSPFEELFGDGTRAILNTSRVVEHTESAASLQSTEDELWNNENQDFRSSCSRIDLALCLPPMTQKNANDRTAPEQFGAFGKLPISKLTDPIANLFHITPKAAKTSDLTSNVRDDGRSKSSDLLSQKLKPATSVTKKARPVTIMECPICGLEIRGKRGNLNRHIATRHEHMRAFRCAMPDCGRALTSKLNLVRHMTRVHEGRPHRCEQCPIGFKTVGTLEKHVRAAHGVRRAFICPTCAVCFGRRSVLENHVFRAHGITGPVIASRQAFSCPKPLCHAKFEDWKDMQAHELETHGGRAYGCTKCPVVFETECDLSRHIRIEHVNARTAVTCPVCAGVYSDHSNLMRHVSTAHKNFVWSNQFE